MTKSAAPDTSGYSDYGIVFDARSQFSLPHGSFGNNVTIFGVDNSSSVHFDNNKNILVLGEGLTQRLDNTAKPVENKYSC